MDRSGAWFIARQAYVHLAVSALAIFTLSVLAYFFFRTLRGFLELRRQEESQRNLAALGRLSATLAHEIRNPLGAIKGLTQVAQERLPQEHDTQELMTTVVAEAERLERLVTDLLTFARPREMKSIEVELNKLVADVVEGLRPQAAEKRVFFLLPSTETGATVWADPDGLKQVFLNVLLNSLEAAPYESEIEVRIQPSEKNFLVQVLDQGPGMGDVNPEDLFQPFVTTKTRGTGLGLPVTRQIIEKLGGTVELRNREPRGAVCRLILPMRKRTGAESQAVAAEVGR